jgi:hypothetical protein
MLGSFLSRFPNRQNVINSFATAAFLVYGWTLYSSFFKAPSWINYLRPSEIVSVYAYSFVTNFFECIFLILILLVVNFVLSGNLWKDKFLSASVVMLIISIGSALVHLHRYENPTLRESFLGSQPLWWGITFSVAFLLSFIVVRLSWLSTLLENLAERFSVFLYIYIPLTILSFIIVLFRMVG